MNRATHTQMPAKPWAVFVCRKMPSPTWLSGSMAIRCAGRSVADVDVNETGEAVVFIALSGLWPDIIGGIGSIGCSYLAGNMSAWFASLFAARASTA